LFSKPPKNSLGIDLGPRYIRGIHVSVDKSGEPYVLQKAELERGDSLLEDFQSLIRELEINPRTLQVYLAISDEDMLFKQNLLIPSDRRKKDVEAAVNLQFPETQEEQVIRYIATEKGEVTTNYMAVSVIKSKVLHLCEEAKKAGIKLSAVDLRVNALWRSVRYWHTPISEMMIIIYDSPRGSMVVAGDEVAKFIREVYAENPRAEIERTKRYLSGQFKVEKEEIVVREDVDEEKAVEEVENRYLIAYGMALYQLSTYKMNFLPGELAKMPGSVEKKKQKQLPSFQELVKGMGSFIPLLLIVVLCISVLVFLSYRSWSLQNELGRTKDRLEDEELVQAEEEYQEIKEEIESVEEKISTVRGLTLTSQAQPVDDLRYITPSGVTIGRVNADRLRAGNFNLAIRGKASNISSVGLFRDNISALPWYEEVDVVYSYKKDEEDAKGDTRYEFEIEAVLKGGAADDR